MDIYKEIYEQLVSGKETALVTVISAGYDQRQGGNKVILSGDRVIHSELDRELTEEVYARVEAFLKKRQSALTGFSPGREESRQLFIHFFNPAPRLIILGGGHVGAALCRIAGQLDYEIILIDDRPSFTSKSAHPDAGRLICDRFDEALDQVESSPSDYIVIVTRGHQHDRLCLEKALERDFAYIGMIGSRSRVSAQMKDLAQSGFSREQLDRVHSPIGLQIGAVTEAEIALSILAEITAVRRSAHSDEAYQNEVLKELMRLEKDHRQAVLATVIKTRGSTPRKAGSQMIVYPDGSLTGTIGGGCAEAEARREALLCFDRAKTGRLKLELTADAAADEGMACGGTMDVYFEFFPQQLPETDPER